MSTPRASLPTLRAFMGSLALKRTTTKTNGLYKLQGMGQDPMTQSDTDVMDVVNALIDGVTVSAKSYGAVADGVTNDGPAIRSAIAAVNAAGGGVVELPPGTYAFDYITIKSNVTLRGAGRGATVLKLSTTADANGLVPDAGATSIGLVGFKVLCVAGAATTKITAIDLDGQDAGTPIVGVVVDDVEIEGATFCSFFTSYAEDIQIGKLYVTDQQHATVLGITYGATAVWFFKGTKRVTASAILINGTDGDGITCDVGTSSGGSSAVEDISIGSALVYGVGRTTTGAGLDVQGAQRVHVGALTVVGTSTTVASFGASIQQDQNGDVPRDCSIGTLIVDSVGSAAAVFSGAQRCTIGTIRARNICQAIASLGGGAQGYAVVFRPAQYLLDGVSAADCTDNTIGTLDLTSDGTGQLDYGVLFQGALVPHPDTSTTPSSCLRNRICDARFIDSAHGPTSGLANFSASGGCTAPSYGAGVNLVSGLDTDGRTRLHKGSDLKVDTGYGTCQIGPGSATYCHFTTDRDNFYFQKTSGATVNSYFNGAVIAIGGVYNGGSGGPTWTKGTGTPEGVVTAPVGSMFSRTDGGAGTTLYVKQSGSGNTGWAAK